MLHSLAQALDKAGVEFLFARAKLQVLAVLIRTGFMESLGQDHFFRTRTDALNYAWERTYCEHKGCTANCYLSKSHKYEDDLANIEEDDSAAIRQ